MSKGLTPHRPSRKAVQTAKAASSRLLEEAASGIDEGALATMLDAARRRWEGLDFGRQLQLAQVLADCRRSELTRHFRNVVQVAAGLKRRADASGREFLHLEACVIFIVRRKLNDGHRSLRAGQRLPCELLTPAWLDGREQMVAVPTDVQPESHVLGARAHGNSAVRVLAQRQGADNNVAVEGSLTCAVVTGNDMLAIAPFHVFTPIPIDGASPESGATVLRLLNTSPPDDSQPVLLTTRFGGRLVRAPARSFDAQFAAISDAGGLAAALAGLRLSATRPVVRDIGELGNLLADGRLLRILVPANHSDRRVADHAPLLAALSMAEADHILEYPFSDGKGQVLHSTLQLQVRFGANTLPGDSGCAVVVPQGDDYPAFVGMHIAGDTKIGTSFVIPAWRLFDPESFLGVGGSVPTEPWTIKNFPV